MQQRCDGDATAQMAMRRNRRESGSETGAVCEGISSKNTEG
jgi:hypothetical protein